MQASDIPDLDRDELRKFGLTTGAIVAVLFGGLIPWIWDFRYPTWPWIVFGILAAFAILAPMLLQSVHRTWMRIGLAISKVTTPIILGIVFFLVIMPVGIVIRLAGRDPLHRNLESSTDTYRVDLQISEHDSLEKPY
jgi:hypothetical protein